MADVQLTPKPERFKPPVACTLGASELPQRLAEWREILGHVTGRAQIDGGLRLSLSAETPVERLAALAVAEQACCGFFRFALTVDGRGVGFEVTGPPDAASVIDELFGQPTG